MSQSDTTSNRMPEATGSLDLKRIEILDGLATKITNLFQKRASERVIKEVEWERSQRLYNAPLSGTGTEMPSLPFGDSNPGNKQDRPEPNIVRIKCDTAISNCVSLQFAAGEKNWDLFPPANTSDPAITQACRLMEKEIQTQLDYAKYPMHSRRAIEDRVIYGTGVLKGPVNTGKMCVEYEQDINGQWVPKVSTEYTPEVVHVPLWRFYPDMSVADFNEVTDTIEVHPMTALELAQFIKHPGFDGDAIKGILRGTDSHDPIRPEVYNEQLIGIKAEMWARNPYLYKNRYMVLEYHGPVTYDDITKLGLEPTYESPTAEYYGEVWVCAGKVIRMELENIEGYYETPYSAAIWKRDPSNLFGFGHPLLLADPQRVVTATYHMMLDNAYLTSGPQVAMYQRYIQPIDGDWTMRPNKAWLLTDPTVNIDKAITFFNPTNNIANIMPVLQLARQFADEESATLAFGGLQSPQNSESATGNLIMQHASTTLLDFMAEEWDDQVTEKIIRRMYAWNMQYNEKPEIKGYYHIDVKSSSEYKNKQMYIRDLERLQMETAQNPAMAMAVNTDELVRARLALMHLPSNKIVKSAEEFQAAQQQMAQRPDPQMIEMQAKMAEVQNKQKELQLREAQLQFESHQAMQEAQMMHDEKMGANQARLSEAQAAVMKARLEMQVELLKLAQKDEEVKARILNDQNMNNLEIQSQVYIKSMEEARKNQENELYNRELDIKEKMGSGI